MRASGHLSLSSIGWCSMSPNSVPRWWWKMLARLRRVPWWSLFGRGGGALLLLIVILALICCCSIYSRVILSHMSVST